MFGGFCNFSGRFLWIRIYITMDKNIYKYVAVIGIDGMGIFNKSAETPCMDAIFENGAVSYSGLSMDPTISAENWGAMLLGVKPTVHKLTNNNIRQKEYCNKELPSVFKRIRDAFPESYLASYCVWNPINEGVIESSANVDTKTAESDAALCELIVEAVKNTPKFLFVQFDNVDGAGHHFGYGTNGHLEQISKADALVGKIYEAYKSAGLLGETLFIVTADHGGYNHSHGGYNDTEKYIFIGTVGKGVKKGEITGFQTRDIAAIVLKALGLSVPECDEKAFSSLVPAGIFDGFVSEKRPEPLPSTVSHLDTPDAFSNGGLFSFIPKERFKVCLFFDSSLFDASKSASAKEDGAVKYYTDGVRGECAELGATGCAEINGFDINKGDLTFSVWLKTDRSLTGSVCVFAARSFGEGQSVRGISMQMRCNDTVFVIADGDDDFEVTVPFPESLSHGWTNVTVSLLRSERKLLFYNDFELSAEYDIEARYLGSLCDKPFVFGDNSEKTYNRKTNPSTFFADDFFIIDGALTKGDLNALKKYYGL